MKIVKVFNCVHELVMESKK